jgi:hypothetical protein
MLDLIAAILPASQATDILTVICSRFSSELTGRSSGDITSPLLKLVRQFSHVSAGRCSLLRLRTRHSDHVQFSDGDWAAVFRQMPAMNGRETMKTFGMLTMVIAEGEATACSSWRPRAAAVDGGN